MDENHFVNLGNISEKRKGDSVKTKIVSRGGRCSQASRAERSSQTEQKASTNKYSKFLYFSQRTPTQLHTSVYARNLLRENTR